LMTGYRIYGLWLLLAITCCPALLAQMPNNEELKTISPADSTTYVIPSTLNPDTSFTVRDIVFVGNRKTRPEIMLREIPFRPGEHYILQELVRKFEIARKQLMNTTLFHEVVVALKSFDGYNVDILVQVKERWYIFPV